MFKKYRDFHQKLVDSNTKYSRRINGFIIFFTGVGFLTIWAPFNVFKFLIYMVSMPIVSDIVYLIERQIKKRNND